jgi:pilus assembly protein CpaF
MEGMVGMTGVTMPEGLVRQTIARALNVVAQLARGSDGRRRLSSVSEISGTEGAVITMQEIFRFDQTGVDAEGRVIGQFKTTGVRPKAMERIERAGIDLAELVRPFIGE